MRDATNVAQLSLDSHDFVQGVVTDSTTQPNTIVQGQADVEREPLEIPVGINIVVKLQILENLVDAGCGLKIDEWKVGLNCLPVESCSRRLASSLDRIVPG